MLSVRNPRTIPGAPDSSSVPDVDGGAAEKVALEAASHPA